MVEKMAIHPRKVFGLPEVRIEAGQAADLTLFHPEKEWEVDKDQLASKSENTPLHGHKMKGQVKGVFHNRQSQFFTYR
jgi:dihydroorotase